jgi:uncharacterized membrane protein
MATLRFDDVTRLTMDGMAAAAIVGTAFFKAGLYPTLMLLVFFVTGSVATKVGAY